MKTIEVKKIWFGDETYKKPKITLRSYQLNGGDIKVIHAGKHMILTAAELKNPVGKRFFRSKIGAQDYYLLDYLWKPNE